MKPSASLAPDPATGQPAPSAVSTGDAQRDALLEAERKAHADQPRSFKEDALSEKVVSVEPDGTGPTSTQSFDPLADHRGDSVSDSQGNVKPAASGKST